MAGNTKGLISDVHRNADRHQSSAEGFRADNKSVRAEVDGLCAVNKGDLMDKLNVLQDEWSDNVEKVTKQLEEMAAYLHFVANEIQGQDSESGGGLR